jgi:membrane-associated protein
MTAPLLVGAAADAFAAGGHLVASPLGFLDPNTLIDRFGTLALAGIVVVIFIETGLIFPFLPGDSLLFTAGMLVAATDGSEKLNLSLPALVGILFVAAFAGNQSGYLIGKLVGPRLFSRPNSRILRQDYLDKTNEYFDKYGGRTIVLAQFVPIVRTFSPIAAGIGRMRYRSFWPFSLVGTFVWTALVTTLGYYLGRVSFIRDNIEPIFVGIVLLSVVPIAIEARRHARAASAGARTSGHAPATGQVPAPRHGRSPGVAQQPRPVPPQPRPDHEEI